MQSLAKSILDGHRSSKYITRILPLCSALVTATGHRMAYEAARDVVSGDMLALYESICLLTDPAWHSENMGMTKQKLSNQDGEAVKGHCPSSTT